MDRGLVVVDGRVGDRTVPSLSALWEVCADVAVQLDEAEADWHMLSEVAAALLPLAEELELVVRRRLGQAQRAQSALTDLRESVEWVVEHQYQASEADLRRGLETALRQVMYILDLVEQLGTDHRAGDRRRSGSAQLSVEKVRKHAADDLLDIEGLAGILAAEEQGERVDLTVSWRERSYRVEMVRVSRDWLLKVLDEQGWSVTDADSTRMTLEAALGCALLDVLRDGQGAGRGAHSGAARGRRLDHAAIKETTGNEELSGGRWSP
jgi:hypothetical protein